MQGEARFTPAIADCVSTAVTVELDEVETVERVPPFDAQHLTAIAKVLADTSGGLTGSEIGYLLRDCKVPDVTPADTKWKRLFNALGEYQNQRQFGNHVVVFISKAMNPAQYTSRPDVFRQRRDQLNSVLSFSGISVGEDGRVRWARRARSLDEALERASRLHSALCHEEFIEMF